VYKIYFCDHSECDICEEAPQFLRAWGLEPSSGADHLGRQISFCLPAEWDPSQRDAFASALSQLARPLVGGAAPCRCENAGRPRIEAIAGGLRTGADPQLAAGTETSPVAEGGAVWSWGKDGRFGCDHFDPGAHGPDGQLCSAYVPTRHELALLARFWAKKVSESILAKHSGDSRGEAGLGDYANGRLNAFQVALGESARDAIQFAAEREVARRVGAQSWDEIRQMGDDAALEVRGQWRLEARRLARKAANEHSAAEAVTRLRADPQAVYLDAAGDMWSMTDEGCAGEEGGTLTLRVTGPRGQFTLARDCTLAKPVDWVPPYGLP
jgi:hypothetical protein